MAAVGHLGFLGRVIGERDILNSFYVIKLIFSGWLEIIERTDGMDRIDLWHST